MNKEVEERLGYNINHVIGFPKLYPEWINLLNTYNNEYFEEHIVIFSRQAGHPYFMDIDKYESLLIEAYQAIRKFYINNLIVIKPHPREEVELINKIIKKEKMKNVKISFCHVFNLLDTGAFIIFIFVKASSLVSNGGFPCNSS